MPSTVRSVIIPVRATALAAMARRRASYPDWETYGKATQALANDAEHTELRGQMMGISHMDDRTIFVGHDV